MSILFLLAFLNFSSAEAKEIALTFDDAPMWSSQHFKSDDRTKELIKKLKNLNVPPVIIFGNVCNGDESAVLQLKQYRDAGHFIGNHTCSHLRLDNIGVSQFSKDFKEADKMLSPLFSGQKFFRYPFLNEGSDEKLRNEMRRELANAQYRNGMVSVDTDDYIFSSKLNQAKKESKKIDYDKVEALFLKHIMGAVDYYDALAVKTIGYSPKHVLLLHEMDATVLFLDSVVKELRKKGWKIISANEAYLDKLYLEQPKNTYAGDGIIAQMAFEKTGKKAGYAQSEEIQNELNKILDLKSKQ